MKKSGLLYFFGSLIIAFSFLAYAQEVGQENNFFEHIFPDSAKIEAKVIPLTPDKRKTIEKRLGYRILEDSFTFYLGRTDEGKYAQALILTEKGKHGPITFLIAVSNKGAIDQIKVLESKEIKGRKISAKRFLRQFVKKTAKDSLVLGKDIIAVSGATISSRAAARAAKKALIIWEELLVEKKN